MCVTVSSHVQIQEWIKLTLLVLQKKTVLKLVS